MAGSSDRRPGGWALAALLLVAGCEARPRAPVLRDEMVYHDAALGLRFVVPEGWRTRSRAELPPGKLAVERPLVEYSRPAPALAGMRVSAADLAPGESIAAYLERNNLRKRDFRAPQPLPPLTVLPSCMQRCD